MKPPDSGLLKQKSQRSPTRRPSWREKTKQKGTEGDSILTIYHPRECRPHTGQPTQKALYDDGI